MTVNRCLALEEQADSALPYLSSSDFEKLWLPAAVQRKKRTVFKNVI